MMLCFSLLFSKLSIRIGIHSDSTAYLSAATIGLFSEKTHKYEVRSFFFSLCASSADRYVHPGVCLNIMRLAGWILDTVLHTICDHSSIGKIS